MCILCTYISKRAAVPQFADLFAIDHKGKGIYSGLFITILRLNCIDIDIGDYTIYYRV